MRFVFVILFEILIKCGNSKIENFDNRINPITTLINYKDLNSPLYSHNVNLPINDPISCKNFCGPKSQCLITREQCTSDVDCKGCNRIHPVGYYINNFSEIYPGSKNSQIKRPYEGVDLWQDSFNKGLELYNKKRSIADKYNSGTDTTTDTNPDTNMTSFETKYPTTISATGLFYETTPPASNSSLFK